MCIADIINTKKFGDLIDIEWYDAFSNENWQSLTDAMKVSGEIFCKTRGFFAGQTEKFIHVIQSMGKTEANEVAGLILIPKGCITEVK